MGTALQGMQEKNEEAERVSACSWPWEMEFGSFLQICEDGGETDLSMVKGFKSSEQW